MNSVSLVGNLGADPKLIVGASGKKRATFRVAVNEGQGDDEKTHWVNCTAFGTLAENLCESLHKGNRVVVVGRFNSYDKEVEVDGDTKSLTMLTVTASSVGPDLRWATSKVSKVTRERNGDQGEGSEGNGKAEVADTSEPSAKPAASSKASKSSSADESDDF